MIINVKKKSLRVAVLTAGSLVSIYIIKKLSPSVVAAKFALIKASCQRALPADRWLGGNAIIWCVKTANGSPAVTYDLNVCN